ncbi:MAG: peptidylprolyl isomerase [Anaerolineales bacterium]|nr:peptidylprolyl isomerase [Anaerolineales bacterium]
MIKTAGGVLLVVVIAFIAWQVLSSDSSSGEGTVVAGERPLAALDPAERDGYYAAPPENILEPGVDYQAIISTEKGEMRLDLYEDEAPLTVNNFIFLANQGFYDGTTFHRVLQDFMAQGGDPSGTGAGGPGYEFADETDNGLVFDRRGLLAMANGGPDTNGSQFFITYGVTDWLDGNHTIFGELTEGDDVLSSLALRDPATATEPGELIERIDIVEN